MRALAKRGIGLQWTSRLWPGLLILLLAFSALDGALLSALPRLHISFSTELLLPLAFSIAIRLVLVCAPAVAVLMSRLTRRNRRTQAPNQRLVLYCMLANLAFTAIQVDAYVVEPLWIQTTELSLAFEDLAPGAPPVRVVHLTDLHIERNGLREEALVRRVNALHPDIIVLTGDHLNLSRLQDPVSAAHFRQLVRQLEAPYGIYAVRGTVEPNPESMAWLVEGTDVVWLEQERVSLDVRGQQVTLVGVACSHVPSQDAERLSRAMSGIPPGAFTLLLYHAPDLIAEAAQEQIDLYLAGHTHGGQIRLPLVGALFTASRYGRQYASGLFERGGTTMYVSRGLGLEGSGMPRARFLCRPEIVSLELRGGTGI
jgi:predicted MPP superfamily phosphohydrolase